MHSCQSCGKSFSRNDSLLRHQREYCKVIIPRRLTHNNRNNVKKVAKSNNLIDLSNLDQIQIMTDMLNEHQYQLRKDFKKLKVALMTSKHSKYVESSVDEDHNSTDDEEHSSSTDEKHKSS